MLPFEKNNERKWQCFVCGRQYLNFIDFKNHIIEQHEEGREYVLCPVGRCGVPVRDVASHCKVLHPNEKIPKKGPMRAMIWKDLSSKGKTRTRKPTFRKGYIVSIKNNGKQMKYRSGLECDFYECLEIIPEITAYDAEPIKGGIPYLFDGESHNYHPDLSIHFADGSVEIWEIKPSDQTSLPVNDAKWRAAEQFCFTRGWKFLVVCEQHLQKLKKRVKQLQS